jgi:hypothetical protein
MNRQRDGRRNEKSLARLMSSPDRFAGRLSSAHANDQHNNNTSSPDFSTLTKHLLFTDETQFLTIAYGMQVCRSNQRTFLIPQSTTPHRLLSPPSHPAAKRNRKVSSLAHDRIPIRVTLPQLFGRTSFPRFPQFPLPHNACHLANRQAFRDPHVPWSSPFGMGNPPPGPCKEISLD